VKKGCRGGGTKDLQLGQKNFRVSTSQISWSPINGEWGQGGGGGRRAGPVGYAEKIRRGKTTGSVGTKNANTKVRVRGKTKSTGRRKTPCYKGGA